MAIVPGSSPDPREGDPLVAEEPAPPGQEDLAQAVEQIDDAVRSSGPAEVREADEQADVAEGDADASGSAERADHGSRSDAEQDPTSDQGTDPEDAPPDDGADPVEPPD